jgi:catechol 2,3-dioxygenase-like lactoylglutathione lyase family enzyme
LSGERASSACPARREGPPRAIGVDDLDSTLAELAGQGIEPERLPYTVREGARLCFVRDPDG